MSRELAELAHLATEGFVGTTSVQRAVNVLREKLRATDVALVYGDKDTFRHFGTSSEFHLTDRALWMLNRELTARNEPLAFDLTGDRIGGFRPAAHGRAAYVGASIPTPNSSAQMLVMRGPWQGLSPGVLRFITAAGPSLAMLLEKKFDLTYAERERHQLDAFINITRIASASENIEDVLSRIAQTISTVAEMEFVTIDLCEASGRLRLRCVNYRRSEQDAWGNGRLTLDELWSTIMASRDPMLFVDTASDARLSSEFRDFMARVLIRSSAVLPVVSAGEALGVLSVASQRPRAFEREEVELLEALAAQVGTAVKGIQLYADLAASQSALRDKSSALERALQFERERARRDSLTGALNHAAVTEELRELISADERRPVTVAMVDIDGMKAVNDTFGHPAGDTVLVAVGNALRSDERAIVGRYGGDEFLVVLPGFGRAAAERYKDDAVMRLAHAGLIDEPSGSRISVAVSIGLTCFPEEAGSIADLIKLSDTAMYAAKWRGSLERSGGADLSRDERATRIVGALVPLLTSPGEVKDKLALVAKRLSVEGGYDAVDCQLFETPLGPPVVLSNATEADVGDHRRRWIEAQSSPTHERQIRKILARVKRPIILNDMATDERLGEREREVLSAAGLRSGIVSPMLWQDELIGILSVAKRQRDAFDARDATFLAEVANQVTAIVRMGTLIDNLRAASDRLASAQNETVVMLAAAAEAHDRTTGMHLQSVRSLAEALARELGYAESEVEALGLASVLHDIGKISVPDSILSSPMRLQTDDWETAKIWEVLKRHSVWGHEFLKERDGFELAAQVARWHHERWDGGGYPDGINGDTIPEQVAIVTVADAFDAMTSDRPYRARRPVSLAVNELAAHAGTQFSPRVVEALLRLRSCGRLVLMQEDRRAAA